MMRWRVARRPPAWRMVLGGAVGALVLAATALRGEGGPAPAALEEKPVRSLGVVTWDATINGDATRIAFVRKEGQRSRFILDGKEQTPYDFLWDRGFSPDGKRFAYLATRAGVGVFVCDGQEKPGHRAFSFSADSKHVAYWTLRTDGDDGAMLLCDQKPLALDVTHVYFGSKPVFSPDGKHLAWFCGGSGKARIVVDGKAGPDAAAVKDPVFSPDGRRLAYAFCQAGRWFVLCGKEQAGPLGDVGALAFSPDGKLTFPAQLGNAGWFILSGGKKEPTFDEVSDPVFSHDGRRMAYGAKDKGKWSLVCGEKQPGAYDAIDTLSFSLDGGHLAFRAKRGEKFLVVCDGRETAPFDDVVWLGFSPDGRHLAAVVRTPGGYVMLCDGISGPPHAKVLVPGRFDDLAGKLRYIAMDRAKDSPDLDASLVEVDWPKGRTWEDAFKPEAK